VQGLLDCPHVPTRPELFNVKAVPPTGCLYSCPAIHARDTEPAARLPAVVGAVALVCAGRRSIAQGVDLNEREGVWSFWLKFQKNSRPA